jgi:hypothetical protein
MQFPDAIWGDVMHPRHFKERRKIQTGTHKPVRRKQSTLYRAWCFGEVTSEELRAGSLALGRMRAVGEAK